MLLNDDFLLTSAWARRLYHDHAEKMPIIDYHCHLVPQEIYENKGYENLTQVWLCDNGFGDHYKWRLMRANGVPERLITGDGDPYEKYLAFVRTIERAAGNPIFEWSHLELRRFFGIDLTICEANAREIWERANALLATPDFRARRLIQRMNVRCVCTTDDPASDLRWHRLLAAEEEACGFKVLPTFRPDALLDVAAPGFGDYVRGMGAASGVEVTDWESLRAAAEARVDFFHAAGGRLADHGMNSFAFAPADEADVAAAVAAALAGEPVGAEAAAAYQTAMTLFLMGAYERHGWTMQVHGNCFRNDSTLGLSTIGRDAGFDTVGDQPDFAFQLKCLMDAAQQAGALPRMILYSLNDSDWLALATLAGAFQGGVRQRIHFGNAWWFNDTYDGMRKQLAMYAQQSLLGNCLGMLTDSRSFLSYPRHEYFRRVLCQVVGEWVDQGRLPDDDAFLGGLVEDVCYNNAHDYFGFFA